jgi:hypothetical protein
MGKPTYTKNTATAQALTTPSGAEFADTPCHECGDEMEGRESYGYVTACGDESELCQKCHDIQNK